MNETERTTLKNGNPRHEFTKDDCVKGGKSGSKIKKALANIKTCSKKCPMFPCFLSPIALADEKKQCIRLKTSEYNWNVLSNIILGGREGVETVYKNLLAKVIMEKGTDALKALDQFIRTIYGDKSKTERTNETHITIEDFKDAFKIVKNEEASG